MIPWWGNSRNGDWGDPATNALLARLDPTSQQGITLAATRVPWTPHVKVGVTGADVLSSLPGAPMSANMISFRLATIQNRTRSIYFTSAYWYSLLSAPGPGADRFDNWLPGVTEVSNLTQVYIPVLLQNPAHWAAIHLVRVQHSYQAHLLLGNETTESHATPKTPKPWTRSTFHPSEL
jgi:hypothetical protein